MEGDAFRGDEEAAGEAERRDEHRLPRPHPLEPFPPREGGEAEHAEGDVEHPHGGRERPVARGRHRAAKEPRQGDVEDTEGVALSDAEVNGEGRGRDQPSVEAVTGDGSLAIEERAHWKSAAAFFSV